MQLGARTSPQQGQAVKPTHLGLVAGAVRGREDDERLEDQRLAAERGRAEDRVVARDLAPAEDTEVERLGDALERRLVLGERVGVTGLEEDVADRVLTERRERVADLTLGLAPEEGVGHADHHAGAVTVARVRTRRTAMRHIAQQRPSVRDDLVARLALDVADLRPKSALARSGRDRRTKPTPHASFSCSGEYRPWAAGIEPAHDSGSRATPSACAVTSASSSSTPSNQTGVAVDVDASNASSNRTERVLGLDVEAEAIRRSGGERVGDDRDRRVVCATEESERGNWGSSVGCTADPPADTNGSIGGVSWAGQLTAQTVRPAVHGCGRAVLFADQCEDFRTNLI